MQERFGVVPRVGNFHNQEVLRQNVIHDLVVLHVLTDELAPTTPITADLQQDAFVFCGGPIDRFT